MLPEIPEIFTNSVWMLGNISLEYGSYSDNWVEQCFHPISQRAIKTSDEFYTSTGVRLASLGLKMS